ncbi:MAG: copper chaperone PCu(A)C [Rhodospirillales bacterium]
MGTRPGNRSGNRPGYRFAVGIVLALCAALSAAPAVAGDSVKAGKLVIFNAWARATPGYTGTAAAYVSIHNHGLTPDRLVGASSPVASRVALHATKYTDGVMRMLRLDDISVEAGEKRILEPGGLHLMLTGLNRRLRTGERFPMVLRFKDSGEVTVTVEVMRVGAKGPEAREGGGKHQRH